MWTYYDYGNRLNFRVALEFDAFKPVLKVTDFVMKDTYDGNP